MVVAVGMVVMARVMRGGAEGPPASGDGVRLRQRGVSSVGANGNTSGGAGDELVVDAGSGSKSKAAAKKKKQKAIKRAGGQGGRSTVAAAKKKAARKQHKTTVKMMMSEFKKHVLGDCTDVDLLPDGVTGQWIACSKRDFRKVVVEWREGGCMVLFRLIV